ncbi:MAG: SH3 domain-containing protein, partial [Chloroflexota bacterium]
TPVSPLATPTPDYPYLQVSADLSLNVRAGPGTQYERAGVLQPGEIARILGQNDIGAGRWWQISFLAAADGVAWVSASPNYTLAFNADQVPLVPAPPLPEAPAPTPTPVPAAAAGGLDFTVDRTTIQAGECVTFRWHVTNVKEVYYRGGGVPGDNQSRVECPTLSQDYELRVVYQDGTVNSKSIHLNVEGGISFRTTDMEAGQTIDFDKDGKVTDDKGDDFEMKEDGDDLIFEKWDDDDDLAQVPVGPVDSLDIIRKQDCDWALDHLDDEDRVKPFEGLAVCFRTDDGRVGKLRFDDVDDNDARIQWALW